jgi:hypothetical protein
MGEAAVQPLPEQVSVMFNELVAVLHNLPGSEYVGAFEQFPAFGTVEGGIADMF